MSQFSENLRRIRFERHMTQEEFAQLLGTSKQNISRYESGAVSPKISTAQSIADKLGVSLAELNGSTEFIDLIRGRDGLSQDFTISMGFAHHPAAQQAREELAEDPDRKALLNLARYGSDRDVKQVAALIDALRATNPDFYDGDDPA